MIDSTPVAVPAASGLSPCSRKPAPVAQSGRIRCARGLVFLALALVAGCGGKAAVRQPRVPVTVAKVERRTVPFELIATGTVEAIQSASVGSQVGGVVTAFAIHEGQTVRAGQPLILLDTRPFHAVLNQARGALARDRAQWETAQANADRARSLFDQKLLSQADWDQARNAAQQAHASVVADSGATEMAALNLEYATIRAPVTGRTGAFNVHIGDLVKAATSEPLVTIVQVHPIRVRFTIPENQLPLVQGRARDLHVFVRPQPEDSTRMAGRLVFMDNAVDAATGTLLLKGEFDNREGRLWPGQFVEARLVLATESDRIVVPAVAIASGQQGTYVYVMNPDSTASPRPVSVARTQGDLAVIGRGLQPGETVVTDGQFRLSPGARIQVRRGSKSESS
jgi:membrane fusion protein, multidrug efflux system